MNVPHSIKIVKIICFPHDQVNLCLKQYSPSLSFRRTWANTDVNCAWENLCFIYRQGKGKLSCSIDGLVKAAEKAQKPGRAQLM